ncbi:uncharacterized protein L203_101953 [Cryptococcus depauperatus CBS 7841]|uniref:Uncharacterized protein n=1 Tax=Cryptococcus depauperatus CBS 7841 TaxID=1295531 RepID=A0A1E3IHC6_9TREE|nr:hypothetical protein L203_03202 [Cryptococcus depauperatus CBS 7841]
MFAHLILSLVLLLGAQSVYADRICYDAWGRSYYCNGGLSWGARLGIGLGIAAGICILFSLCGFWRRQQIRTQFAKYRPPALPFTNHHGQSSYANNPPPPPAGWNNNPYGSNPAPPPQTYQPSMAGQYGTNAAQSGSDGHEHGYEWEQARQEEERKRQEGLAGESAPPGYNVATSPQNTANASAQYAPPVGPPPSKAKDQAAV